MSIESLERTSTLSTEATDELADHRLAKLISAADAAEQEHGEVPQHLIQEIRDAVSELRETFGYVDYDQLAIVAMADAFHFTGDAEIIQTALKATSENKNFDNETSEPVVKALYRIAVTGMTMADSMKIETGRLPHIPSVSSDESDIHVYTTPLGPEYDFLFHPSIRRPDTPEYKYGGIHKSILSDKDRRRKERLAAKEAA